MRCPVAATGLPATHAQCRRSVSARAGGGGGRVSVAVLRIQAAAKHARCVGPRGCLVA